MDAAFLNTILIYINALNAAEEQVGADGTPYLGRCEVIFDGQLTGYLLDRVGGQWQYEVCSEDEQTAFEVRTARRNHDA